MGGDQGRVDTADVIHTQYNTHTGGGRQRGGEEGIETEREGQKAEAAKTREAREEYKDEGVETKRCEGEERTQKGGRKLSL